MYDPKTKLFIYGVKPNVLVQWVSWPGRRPNRLFRLTGHPMIPIDGFTQTTLRFMVMNH